MYFFAFFSGFTYVLFFAHIALVQFFSFYLYVKYDFPAFVAGQININNPREGLTIVLIHQN
jgi:hypothetical protein